MASRENTRIMWEDEEPLDDFRKGMELTYKMREGLKPYEKTRFGQGWIYIEWSSYNPLWKSDFSTKTELATRIYQSLESGEGTFTFDENNGLWKSRELVPAVKEICRQLNPRMQRFLNAYNGKHLLLDRKSPRDEEKPDWDISADVTWFLKRK